MGKPDKKALKQEKALRREEDRQNLIKARQLASSMAESLKIKEEETKNKGAVLNKGLVSEEETAPEGVVQKFRSGMAKTRQAFNTGLSNLVLGKKEINRDVLEGLEEILLGSDMGVETAGKLLALVEQKVRRKELNEPEKLRAVLREEIALILNRPSAPLALDGLRPAVVLFLGVNGAGKTTTIGKVAGSLVGRGKKVLLAAGDTFRAAAAEQLEQWSLKTGADILFKDAGADPASVIYQAVQKGVETGADYVLCDTAGRLHTKSNLMEELKKIRRVITKAVPEAPHETWLVLDGNTGQNAIHQTREFHQAVGLTGLIITKLDGTARGGVVVGIVNEFNIPIRFIGLGEGVEDLRPFDAAAFSAGLLE
ncbi:MAG: signal recognition particle-docking protein FtsY [Deltaproteobacteria bacterium]|nr:signal recognition particle-docking protein FtsY [Deltaproteobacteria bacterium]